MPSAAAALHVALADAVEADPDAAIFSGDRIYSREAPTGSALPYVTIGDTGEGEWNTFGAPGSTVDVTLGVWAADLVQCLSGWAVLESLLHRRPLPIGGREMLQGTARLVTTFRDPVSGAEHGVVRYTATVRAG